MPSLLYMDIWTTCSELCLGRKGDKRKIRYKSPGGFVFKSRGPLLRKALTAVIDSSSYYILHYAVSSVNA